MMLVDLAEGLGRCKALSLSGRIICSPSTSTSHISGLVGDSSSSIVLEEVWLEV